MRVDGVKQPVAVYNLDVIISVGYRVKSKCGIAFRIWARQIIKDYLVRGYAINQRIHSEQIVNARVHNLEWSHVRRVLSVTNPEARLWYLTAASENMWSTRELDRNISTQYFERRLAAQLPANPNELLARKKKIFFSYFMNEIKFVSSRSKIL